MRSDEFYCKVLSEEVICSGFERKSKYDFPGTARHHSCDCIIITASAAMQQVINFYFLILTFAEMGLKLLNQLEPRLSWVKIAFVTQC